MAEKKKGRVMRHWVQAAWFALTNGYVLGFLEGKIYRGKLKSVCVPGLNCYSCPGALGACPIGSLQAVMDSGKFQVSCYVFGFLILFGTCLGRFVCGWLCPFGLVQDLLHWIPIFRKRKNLPGHSVLVYLKYGVLALFVLILPATVAVTVTGMGEPWFCKYICPSGTLLGGLPLLAANPSFRSAAGALFGWKFAVLLAVILLSVKYYRPFCKYLCPLGAVYGWFNPIALYRLRVDEDKCVKCSACQKACGMDIPVWEKPNSVECIRCGDCRAVCPTGAIETTAERFRQRKMKRETEKGLQ